MAEFVIEPERATLHGHFSRDLPPVLTIDPGDSVRYRTLDAAWSLGPPAAPGERPPKFALRDRELDAGHALCGPIAIRGAAPGMTLAVHVAELRTGTYGWTVAGGWPHAINQRLGLVAGETMIRWTLDPDRLLGHSPRGHQVALRPFMGVMGLPPDEPGRHATAPPRFCGGNIDCKELTVGSTLYLPVTVPGALFSVGDGHARQGDGESSVTAIECPMERVVLRFELRPDLHLMTPRARTGEGWLTFGFSEDLDTASLNALAAMVDLMQEQYGFDRGYALALASVVVDLRITQICNGVQGVHAVLPDGAIGKA